MAESLGVFLELDSGIGFFQSNDLVPCGGETVSRSRWPQANKRYPGGPREAIGLTWALPREAPECDRGSCTTMGREGKE